MDPITITLSQHQLALLARLDNEAQAINARRAMVVETIVAGRVDPSSYAGWSASITPEGITLTPPE